MAIEEKISLGLTSVRIITREDPADLMHYLRTHNYGVTSIDGEGATGGKNGLYHHQAAGSPLGDQHHKAVQSHRFLFRR